jgi:flavin reductase (DIM6/NTAB) family NADH-FMN oxidoreductase RutF
MDQIGLPELRISLFPRPVVIVTSVDANDVVGATTISWTGIVSSRPPTVSVAFLPDSFTRQCIVDSREFVVNVPDGGLVVEANLLGTVSGPWDYKLAELASRHDRHLTLAPSTLVRSPRISECYLSLECRCLLTQQVGLYDVFCGEVMKMHVRPDVLRDDHPRGNIDHTVVQPLVCLGDEYWAGSTMLGHSTENKDHPHGGQH